MTTSNTDQMREAFEAWAESQGYGVARHNDAYIDRGAAHAWFGWRGALSSASSGAGVLSDPEIDALLRNTIGFEGERGELQEVNRHDLHAVVRAALNATQRAEPVAQSGLEVLTAERDEARAACIELAHKVSALEARAALNAAPPAAVQETDEDATGLAFESWWRSDGQYVRSGGGDYEKCFAYAAWNASLAIPERPAPAANAEPVAANADEWCEYIAGLIVAYLGGPTPDDSKIKPIAGIIERRLHHLTRPAAPLSEGFNGPTKWTPEEIADGHRGIRWITRDGVHGRPTAEDCRDYLIARGETPLGVSPAPQPTDEATDAGRREWTQQDAQAWAERHDIKLVGNDLFCAFEDAATAHMGVAK